MTDQEFAEHLARLVPWHLFEKHIVPNMTAILQLQWVWNKALLPIGNALGIPPQHLTSQRLQLGSLAQWPTSLLSGKPKLAGIAGPGAAGKTTLARALGYPRILNTTTRTPRTDEVDGVDYEFLDNESFKQAKENGDFILTTYREGRGWYGTKESLLLNAFLPKHALAKIHVIEKSPPNLIKISRYLQEIGIEDQLVVIYVIPPLPIFPHLVLRLAKRCEDGGENFAKTLESTLGERQVTEMASLVECIEKKIPVLILVNDEIGSAVNFCRSILE